MIQKQKRSITKKKHLHITNTIDASFTQRIRGDCLRVGNGEAPGVNCREGSGLRGDFWMGLEASDPFVWCKVLLVVQVAD